MFEEFFQLRENPFALAPNPRFIFRSQEHTEALAHLRFWIENGEGFVLITGEVGTGKTTALFDLMGQLPNEWAVAFVANSTLTGAELLEEICRRFQVVIPRAASKPALLERLERHLTDRGDRGLGSVLILDEAQNYENRLLEEVRLLSNLERAQGKLLQIALVGQPELERKLEQPDLRQLRQRIGIRYRLNPLSEEETIRYLQHRLSVAGGDAERIFPRESGVEVHRLTHGIPREINVVASQALISAFVQGAPQVSPEIVRSVVLDFAWSSILGRGPLPPVPRPSERASEQRLSESRGVEHRAPEHRMPEPRVPEHRGPEHRVPPDPRMPDLRSSDTGSRPPLEVVRGGMPPDEPPAPQALPEPPDAAPPRMEPLIQPSGRGGAPGGSHAGSTDSLKGPTAGRPSSTERAPGSRVASTRDRAAGHGQGSAHGARETPVRQTSEARQSPVSARTAAIPSRPGATSERGERSSPIARSRPHSSRFLPGRAPARGRGEEQSAGEGSGAWIESLTEAESRRRLPVVWTWVLVAVVLVMGTLIVLAQRDMLPGQAKKTAPAKVPARADTTSMAPPASTNEEPAGATAKPGPASGAARREAATSSPGSGARAVPKTTPATGAGQAATVSSSPTMDRGPETAGASSAGRRPDTTAARPPATVRASEPPARSPGAGQPATPARETPPRSEPAPPAEERAEPESSPDERVRVVPGPFSSATNDSALLSDGR